MTNAGTGEALEDATVTVRDDEDVTEDFDLEDKLTVEVVPETQTVSFDISDLDLAENETVTVDVGNATDLGVDYDGATFSTTGSGTASMNTTGDAIVYTAFW